MKATVLGTQLVDYVSKRTNQPVKGFTLFVAYRDSQVTGHSVSNVFISDNLGIPGVIDIKPGSYVDVEYNNRGFVCGLEVLVLPTPESAAAIRTALDIYPGHASPSVPPAPEAASTPPAPEAASTPSAPEAASTGKRK